MNTPENPHVKARPYWHVDLKWICSIGAFFALAVTLLFVNLAALTERERAVTLSATVVASLFSPNGLDDETGVEEFRQMAATMPGDTVVPIEQYPWLQISKQDITTLSPRELRIKIFRQLTEPIYDKGLAGAARQFSADPVEQQKFQKDAAALGVLTKTTHDATRQVAIVAGVITLIFLAGAVIFSAGWGRLVTSGVIALLVGPLGAVVGLLLKYPPQDGDAPLAKLSPEISSQLSATLLTSYGVVCVVGVGLLVSAGVGKLALRIIRHSRRMKQEKAQIDK